MNMLRRPTDRRARGQVLVIVAAALVGLVALAGLAIDGGNLFMQRRRAQNAADAGALAGTQFIARAMMTCDEIDYGELDLEIARVVNARAEENGITDTNNAPGDEVNTNVIAFYVNPNEVRLATVGHGDVPLGTSGVEASVRDQHRTYFLTIVGIRHIPSSARAVAMAGIVREWEGSRPLLPIAVPQVVLDSVEAHSGNGCEVGWEMHDTGDGEFCYQPLDENCLPDGDPICPEDPGSPQSSLRGWLNFNYIYNGDHTGAADPVNRTYENAASAEGCLDAPKLPGLTGYASEECAYRIPPIYAGDSCEPDPEKEPDPEYGTCTKPFSWNGDFVHGSSGAETVSLMEVYRSWGGQSVACPVFDRVVLREDMHPDFLGGAESPTVYETRNPDYDVVKYSPISFPNGGDFPTSAGGTSDNWFYHIVGWVMAEIPDEKDNKILYGQFEQAEVEPGKIDIATLDDTCSLLVHGVTLWR